MILDQQMADRAAACRWSVVDTIQAPKAPPGEVRYACADERFRPVHAAGPATCLEPMYYCLHPSRSAGEFAEVCRRVLLDTKTQHKIPCELFTPAEPAHDGKA